MTESTPKRRRAKRAGLLRRMLTARGRSLEITRAGALFILLTLGIGFAAINSGSNLLHIVFGAQMALIVGSGVLSEATVRRARAQRIAPDTIHAGASTPMEVRLTNADPHRELLSVSVEDDDRVHTEAECAPVFSVRVPPGTSSSLTTTVTMPTRGRHRLPPAVVATRFPFGLFVKRRHLESPHEVLVFPRVHPVPSQDGTHDRPGRGTQAGRVARVGEFFGLREYREGDDPRRIYWPASTRLQRPVVREHEALGDREVVLDLPSGRTGEPAFEAEVERVASAAVAHLQRPGVRVGLRRGHGWAVEPGTGPGHRRRILETLAIVGDPPQEGP